jgi:glyoxylase-like metal-dependent hydrolase (beta-lactamase superfamily II)
MPAIAEGVPMKDGDVLSLPGSPVIIGMPGHSPGSVAIHVPSVGAVFVGTS